MLLPRFYTWGAIAGAIALPAFVAVPLSFPEYRGPAIAASAFIILGCILIMLYGANSLTPELTAATDAGPGATGRLRRLQRRSTFLNATVLLAGIGLLIAHANRPAPHTAGIRQLSPEEMARVDSELAPIIEQIEIKYGFRPGPAGAGPASVSSSSAVDPETIEEIESYLRAEAKPRAARRGRNQAQPEDQTKP